MINSSIYILIADVLLYPSDLLTTRLQADNHNVHRQIRITRLIGRILRKEGIPGLYRGFGTMAIGSFPGQFSYYLAYEYSNDLLRSHLPANTANQKFYYGLLSNALAGMMAEAVSAFSYVPTDIITQRLQVERHINFLPVKYQYPHPWLVMKHTWQTEGLKGYFRGFWPYMFVFGPMSAVWWTSYEFCKSSINWAYSSKFSSISGTVPFGDPLNHLVSGSVAGVASVLVTNPLDVARTRLQLLETKNSIENKHLSNGFMKLLARVYREEGVNGLYKGMKPRILIRVPGSALAFLGYEQLKQMSLKTNQAINSAWM